MSELGSARVITVSTRASAGAYADRSGPILVEGLRKLGFDAAEPVVIPDGPQVAESLKEALAGQFSLVVTTGGTGLNPSDNTPEQTRPLLDYEIPHLTSELVRYGVEHGVPTAMLSRGIAGVAGNTLVLNLPGSTGGVRDGLAVLGEVLPHAVRQLRGGDH